MGRLDNGCCANTEPRIYRGRPTMHHWRSLTKLRPQSVSHFMMAVSWIYF